MSISTGNLSRKIGTAGDLQSVVRTMKALAASSVGQYQNSVIALADYYRAVELGLGACLRAGAPRLPAMPTKGRGGGGPFGAVVFGSDQGLVGKFNESMAEFAIEKLAALPGDRLIWAVGERVYARLADAGLAPITLFAVPSSVKGVAALVGQIQVEIEARQTASDYAGLYVFHNRPQPGALYEPAAERLLPLDDEWQRRMTKVEWPTRQRPELMGEGASLLAALVAEYLFISLFRACAESLASENTSRLAAMERAETNIGEVLDDLTRTFHQLRQRSIDEELFDVLSGYESQT